VALGLFWGMGSGCGYCRIYGGIFQEKKVVLKGEMTVKPKAIIILLLIVMAIVIVIQNSEMVTLQLFFWKIMMSRIIFMGGLLVVGLYLVFLVVKTTQKILILNMLSKHFFQNK